MKAFLHKFYFFYPRYAVPVLCILLALVGAASHDALAVTYDIDIKASGPAGAFNPSSLTINSGDTVRWTALGDGQQVSSDQHPSHTEYPDPACPNVGCFDSPLLSTNDTFSFTFQIPGVWNYHNHQLPGRTGTITVNDTNAPAVTADLTASGPTSSTINLSWTSPGDDVGSTANFGTPASYAIRYSTATITEGNWASATPVSDTPTKQTAGSSESVTVTGLTPETTYYFALKTSDEIPNQSAISNVASATTTVVPPDSTPPAAVSDLALSNATTTSIKLSWTAPGDDDNTGTATSYDVRYSTATITAGNWASATPVSGEPTPLVAGSAQSMTIAGLSASTTYYFALKTSDDVPNVSALSNVPSLATASLGGVVTGGGISDFIPPAPVADLSVRVASNTEVELTWTAPGDDEREGTAKSYDVRYSRDILTPSTFSFATQVKGEPAPKAAGTAESLLIGGLEPFAFYYFAMKTTDEEPNESKISNITTITMNPPDFVPPAAILDLAFTNPAPTAVTLTWTAPGDNKKEGQATSYDIRYLAHEELTDATWGTAIQFVNELLPAHAGSLETFTIPGFDHEITYYIALKAYDAAGNVSQLSNVISFTTPPEPAEEEFPVKKESVETPRVRSILKEGALVRAAGGAEVYVVRGGGLLWVPSAAAFERAGYAWSEIQSVESAEISRTFRVAIVRGEGTEEVFTLHSGKRRHIPSPEFFESEGHAWGDIVAIPLRELAWYPPLLLLRASGDAKVYYVRGAFKQWIATEKKFLETGFLWNDIVEVDTSILDSYQESPLLI